MSVSALGLCGLPVLFALSLFFRQDLPNLQLLLSFVTNIVMACSCRFGLGESSHELGKLGEPMKEGEEGLEAIARRLVPLDLGMRQPGRQPAPPPQRKRDRGDNDEQDSLAKKPTYSQKQRKQVPLQLSVRTRRSRS